MKPNKVHGLHQLQMIFSSFKTFNLWPTKFLIGAFLALYGYIMFRCFKLMITKLSAITSEHHGLSLLKHKFLEMLDLTKKYFIIFIRYFYKTKGVEITC